MEKEKLAIYDDDNTLLSCPIKSRLVNCLKNLYDLSLAEKPKNAIESWIVAEYLKNFQGKILIWNNLKTSCAWFIDLCKRCDCDYAIIERNLMPSQLDDYFMLFAGGISFDSVNLYPKFFQKETYQHNIDSITKYYQDKNLIKKSSKKKIVFVGQLVWDSTMTHFYKLDSYDNLITNYIIDNNIDTEQYEIVFCQHPILNLRLKDKLDQYPVNCNLVTKYKTSTQETVVECLDAEKVVTISSTIIYQLMALGIDVEILGQGSRKFPALRNWDKLDQCFSTIMDFQFSINDKPERIKNIINRTISITKDTL